jgi:hypothetical protein
MSRVALLMVGVMLALVGRSADAGSSLPETCAAAKQRAAAKRVGSTMKCVAQATAHGTSIDPTCVNKADSKFSDSIAKIESNGGCVVTGDAAVIAGACDSFVNSIAALTPVKPTTSTTATTTSTTSTTIPACTPATCGGATAPECDGTCPAGMACVLSGGHCLGDLGNPCVCDADCSAPGSGPCVFDSPQCFCESAVGACRDLFAGVDVCPPVCGGTCPDPNQVCGNVSGTCGCIPPGPTTTTTTTIPCPTDGSSAACSAFQSAQTCVLCCSTHAPPCNGACGQAVSAGCTDVILNSACAGAINTAGCASVCCP